MTRCLVCQSRSNALSAAFAAGALPPSRAETDLPQALTEEGSQAQHCRETWLSHGADVAQALVSVAAWRLSPVIVAEAGAEADGPLRLCSSASPNNCFVATAPCSATCFKRQASAMPCANDGKLREAGRTLCGSSRATSALPESSEVRIVSQSRARTLIRMSAFCASARRRACSLSACLFVGPNGRETPPPPPPVSLRCSAPLLFVVRLLRWAQARPSSMNSVEVLLCLWHTSQRFAEESTPSPTASLQLLRRWLSVILHFARRLRTPRKGGRPFVRAVEPGRRQICHWQAQGR